jgi:hypothetical protein
VAAPSEEEREDTHLRLKTLKDFTFGFGFKKFCVVGAIGVFIASTILSLFLCLFCLGFSFCASVCAASGFL